MFVIARVVSIPVNVSQNHSVLNLNPIFIPTSIDQEDQYMRHSEDKEDIDSKLKLLKLF